jgi:hypothetical protein
MAALEAGFLSDEQAADAARLDVSGLLPELTDRALSTPDFIRKMGKDADPWLEKRMSTSTARPLRLPSRYVDSVVGALMDGLISRGKAARMLMIDETAFAERFGLEPALAE